MAAPRYAACSTDPDYPAMRARSDTIIRRSAERAYLLHVLLGTPLDHYTTPRLSAEATTLRAILHEYREACRRVGLLEIVEAVIGRCNRSRAVARRTVEEAQHLETISLGALAAFGSPEEILERLGATPGTRRRPRTKRFRATRRDVLGIDLLPGSKAS